jgi:predicted metal-binding membrane protein
MTAHPLSGQRSAARGSRFAGGGRTALWLGFFALVLGAWGVLMWMSAASQLPPGSEAFGADYWRSICAVSPGIAGFPAVFGMWAVMSAAMMAPTALPAFRTYLDLGYAGAGSSAGFWALIAGYLFAWMGFSVLAAALQLGLASAGWLRPDGVLLAPGASAALLVLAGLYQLSPAKAACLSKCRAPLTFFVANWRDGAAGAAAMGLRLGLVCVGCCWALMLLAFVGGTMNLAFMGLATLVMVLEKLPDVGRLLTRPLAAVLIVAGLMDALRLTNVI